ncbi:MAG: uL15 family ribosomal protein [Nitrososphaerales archaeon]
MPTRLRKVRKLRGSRTHGWGQIGQHRKSGRKGGRGKAGLHKHKWSWVVKYAPEHFSRDSLKPKKESRPRRWINLSKLEEIAQKQKTNEINLTNLGYDKLLGSGEIKTPMKVTVRAYTKQAKSKIEAVGGQLIEG